LAERFGWHIHNNDETDIESLLPFVFHLASQTGGGHAKPYKRAFADEVSWL